MSRDHVGTWNVTHATGFTTNERVPGATADCRTNGIDPEPDLDTGKRETGDNQALHLTVWLCAAGEGHVGEVRTITATPTPTPITAAGTGNRSGQVPVQLRLKSSEKVSWMMPSAVSSGRANSFWTFIFPDSISLLCSCTGIR